jgi:hypothetical protein
MVRFGDGKPSSTQYWAKAPFVTYRDYTHPDFAVPAQQFNVITIPLAHGSGEEFLYFAERWPDSNRSGGNAPPLGTKASGLQALVPMTFDSRGTPLPMRGIPDQFQIRIEPLIATSDSDL